MTITSLKLTNFRQFKDRTFEFDPRYNIIEGPNARGKSSIVEAIYMLATGQSPWTSENTNLIRLNGNGDDDVNGNGDNDLDSLTSYQALANGVCRIEADLESNEEVTNLALVLETRGSSTTRQYLLDGHPTMRNKFTQKLYCSLFSPDLIDKLMFEPKLRRDYLDFQLSQVNTDFDQTIQNYGKILRNRNSLLKHMAGKKYNFRQTSPGGISEADTSQLSFWTQQLVDIGSDIIKARNSFINTLNQRESKLYPTQIKYLPKVGIPNLDKSPDKATIMTNFNQQIEAVAGKELLIGQSLVGPHRDDWALHFEDKNLNLYGSRGEKRMAIADIIFKINLYLKEKLQENPILLLDDITSELDSDNINLLFDSKIDANQQVLITTTNAGEIPEAVRKVAKVVGLVPPAHSVV